MQDGFNWTAKAPRRPRQRGALIWNWKSLVDYLTGQNQAVIEVDPDLDDQDTPYQIQKPCPQWIQRVIPFHVHTSTPADDQATSSCPAPACCNVLECHLHILYQDEVRLLSQ